VFKHADILHVWVNAIVISGALLLYNMLAVFRGHLADGGLLQLFLRPPPQAGGTEDTAGAP